jgi:hypothetical protein
METRDKALAQQEYKTTTTTHIHYTTGSSSTWLFLGSLPLDNVDSRRVPGVKPKKYKLPHQRPQGTKQIASDTES